MPTSHWIVKVLTSKRRGPFSTITGLYAQVEDTDRVEERKRQLNTAISRPVFTQGAKTPSTAVFVQLTWQASDALGITVGGRCTQGERDFSLKVTNPLGLASLSPATRWAAGWTTAAARASGSS